MEREYIGWSKHRKNRARVHTYDGHRQHIKNRAGIHRKAGDSIGRKEPEYIG
jgi:hypothetical protein